MNLPDWLVMGAGQGDPRVAGFAAAACAAGYAPPHTLAYQTLLDAQIEVWPWTNQTLLRLDSPSGDWALVRRLMAAGITGAEQAGLAVCSAQQLHDARLEQGELIAPHQFHYGFVLCLEALARALARQPVRACLHSIPDIICCYDKHACHARLQQAGIPVPRALSAHTYADLRAQMREQRLTRVFVKSRFGSGGSGIVALATSAQGRIEAYTTVQAPTRPTDRLFGSRKVLRLTQEHAIAALIDRLCAWGVQVEQWIPKASVGNHCVDLRILMVAGEPAFSVLRKSHSPITNLYLRNQRADSRELIEQLPAGAWEAVLETGRRVARLFPHSFHLGLDVVVDVSLRRHAVLEVNAFGDCLKGITRNGLNPYEWQLQELPAWLKQLR